MGQCKPLQIFIFYFIFQIFEFTLYSLEKWLFFLKPKKGNTVPTRQFKLLKLTRVTTFLHGTPRNSPQYISNPNPVPLIFPIPIIHFHILQSNLFLSLLSFLFLSLDFGHCPDSSSPSPGRPWRLGFRYPLGNMTLKRSPHSCLER